jgi:hypothetical protein
MKTADEFYSERARGLWPATWDFRTWMDYHDANIRSFYESDREHIRAQFDAIFDEVLQRGSKCFVEKDGVIILQVTRDGGSFNGEFHLTDEEVCKRVRQLAREADRRQMRTAIKYGDGDFA